MRPRVCRRRFPSHPRRQRCVPSSSRRPPGGCAAPARCPDGHDGTGWSNGAVTSRRPTVQRIDDPDEEGPDVRLAEQRDVPRIAATLTIALGRLALDPLGAARRRPDAAAHPAARARRRAPGRRRRGRAWVTDDVTAVAVWEPPRRHRSPAGRRVRGAGPGAALPGGGPVGRRPRHRGARRRAPGRRSRTGGWPTSASGRRRGGGAWRPRCSPRCWCAATPRARSPRPPCIQLGERAVPARLRLRGHPRPAGRRTTSSRCGCWCGSLSRAEISAGGLSISAGAVRTEGEQPARGRRRPEEERDAAVPAQHHPARRRGAAAGGPGAGHARPRRAQRGDAGRRRLGVRRRRCTSRSVDRRPCATATTCSSPTARTSRARSTSAGSTIIEAADLDAALALGRQAGARPRRRCPIEVRPVRGAPSDRRRSSACSASTTGGRSPSWSASSATSTPPRRRCRTPSSTAVQRWPVDGVPPSPAGWIVTTARNRAIDRLRREASRADRYAPGRAAARRRPEPAEEGPVRDDRLRLIFTCCHPALAVAGAGGADAAAAGRPDDGRDRRARSWCPSRRWPSGWCGRRRKIRDARIPYRVPTRGRAARPAARRARRRLPDLHRGPHGDVRRAAGPRGPVRRGDPAGPAAGRADARRAGGDRAAGADAARRVPPGGAHRPGRRLVLLADQDRAPWDRGADRRGPGAGPRAACAATGPGRTRSRRRSTPCTATRRPRRPPTGARSWRSTTSCWRSRRARWWRCTGRSRWPRWTGPAAALALVDGLDLAAPPPLPRRARRPAAPAGPRRRGGGRLRRGDRAAPATSPSAPSWPAAPGRAELMAPFGVLSPCRLHRGLTPQTPSSRDRGRGGLGHRSRPAGRRTPSAACSTSPSARSASTAWHLAARRSLMVSGSGLHHPECPRRAAPQPGQPLLEAGHRTRPASGMGVHAQAAVVRAGRGRTIPGTGECPRGWRRGARWHVQSAPGPRLRGS